jgi:hypothetical protein
MISGVSVTEEDILIFWGSVTARLELVLETHPSCEIGENIYILRARPMLRQKTARIVVNTLVSIRVGFLLETASGISSFVKLTQMFWLVFLQHSILFLLVFLQQPFYSQLELRQFFCNCCLFFVDFFEEHFLAVVFLAPVDDFFVAVFFLGSAIEEKYKNNTLKDTHL